MNQLEQPASTLANRPLTHAPPNHPWMLGVHLKRSRVRILNMAILILIPPSSTTKMPESKIADATCPDMRTLLNKRCVAQDLTFQTVLMVGDRSREKREAQITTDPVARICPGSCRPGTSPRSGRFWSGRLVRG